jgi:hypothetical protein
MTSAWTVNQGGRGSPFVTSTDGTNNVIVWGIGAENSGRLTGFDGDTGATIFAGGGANELMNGTHRFQTAIAARGRIYVATDNRIYAFSAPLSGFELSAPTKLPDGTFQFSFTNNPGVTFTAVSTTNASLPLSSWTSVGTVVESPPGQFQFSDSSAASNTARFYRVRSP